MTTTAHAQPFRIFFLLAALDAIAGVAIWLLAPLGISAESSTATPLAIWHRQELLSGAVPAMLAGLILTALPRWTRRRPVAPFVVGSLAAVWLAGRVVYPAAPLIAALFIALLTLTVAYEVAAARDRRNIKVVILLAILAAGTATADSGSTGAAGELGSRLSLAAILGLLINFGGRVVPSVTEAYLGERAKAFPRHWERPIETIAAAAAGLAIAAWAVAPSLEATALACAVAAIAQTARLLQWRIWRIAAKPAVLVLHIGYGWIAAGFALAAAGPLDPGFAWEDAAVHAWTAGAVGLCGLGLMSSMTRRHTRTAFEPSPLMSAAYACGLAAAIARLAGVFLVETGTPWLYFAALSWMAAYTLFIIYLEKTLARRH